MTRDARSVSPAGSLLRSILLGTNCLCVVATALARAAPRPTAEPAPQSSDSRSKLLVRGKTLYTSLCERCHGADGDATDYSGIVPLSGIDLRLPPGQIVAFSAPFVGRTFEGPEAEALVAYLATLHGAKGFASPGYLFSANLLHHQLPKREAYRVLDARSQAAYEQVHVPNAVHWPLAGQEAGLGFLLWILRLTGRDPIYSESTGLLAVTAPEEIGYP